MTQAVATADAAASRTAARGRMRRRFAALRTLLFYAVVAALLYDGWHNRNDHLITAKHGIGYAFGIIGGSMMLVMLLYSARKNARFMRRLGPIRYWFQAHMIFGILGPTFIIYHSNFQLGSLNSRVALFCMLAVAGSGLAGRYIYSRIHHGLYGSKLSLARLREDAAALRTVLAGETVLGPELIARLDELEQSVLTPKAGVLATARRLVALRLQARRVERRLRASMKHTLFNNPALDRSQAKRLYRAGRRYVRLHLATVRKIAGLAFYQKLFALWHIVHVPLFVMLVISGTVHVVAVHMY